MKRIVVLPVKNEEWILEKFLTAISLWADHIIVAYQASYDRTLEILKKFPKVTIVENPATVHSSNVRKLLLDAARNFDGNNAIFSFDADEIPTAHILSEEFNQKLASMPPATAIELQWVNLWRSPLQYRDDKSVWSNSWKQFGFIDDRTLEYKALKIVSDHTTRLPSPELQQNVRLELPKVLHYQFVNWERLLSKQAHYRMTEFEQSGKSWFEVLKINLKYYPSKDEHGLRLSEVPHDWIAGYEQQGLDLKNILVPSVTWFDKEMLERFARNTPAAYADLDIWDIAWEARQKLALQNGQILASGQPVRDPRNPLQKFWQGLLPLQYALYRFYSRL